MNFKEIFTKRLQSHPLYKPDLLRLFHLSDDTWSIDYRLSNIPNRETEMCFSVNIIKGIFYLLQINLPKDQRGKGHGKMLYDMLTEIARDCGCDQIRQTPSGWTHTKEPRESYLLRHGWLKSNGEVYRDLRAVTLPSA